ncbi:MAG: hypothetical protein ACNA7U_06685 [Candidatus Izemoplasmataceae bacterium]
MEKHQTIYEDVLKKKEKELEKLTKEKEEQQKIDKYNQLLDLGLYEVVPLFEEHLFDYRDSYTGTDGQRYKVIPLELSDEQIDKVAKLDEQIKELKKETMLEGDTLTVKFIRRSGILFGIFGIIFGLVLIAFEQYIFGVSALLLSLFFMITITALSEIIRKFECVQEKD